MPDTNINIFVDLVQLIGKVKNIANANRESQRSKNSSLQNKKQMQPAIAQKLTTPQPALSSTASTGVTQVGSIADRRPAAYVQPSDLILAPVTGYYYSSNGNGGLDFGLLPAGLNASPIYYPSMAVNELPPFTPINNLYKRNTYTGSQDISEYLVLPIKREVGIVCVVRDQGSAGIEYRTGEYPGIGRVGWINDGGMGSDRYSLTNPLIGKFQRTSKFTGVTEVLTQPYPSLPAEILASYGSEERQINCYVYNSTSAREIQCPSILKGIIDEYFPTLTNTVLAGERHFNCSDVNYTTGEDQNYFYESWDVPTNAQILSSPKVDMIVPTRVHAAQPGKPIKKIHPLVRGYGIETLGGSGTYGWGPGTYLYLDGLFLDVNDETPIETLRPTMQSLGLERPWIHSFIRAGERGRFNKLTGDSPTGTIEEWQENNEGRYWTEEITENNRWRESKSTKTPKSVIYVQDNNSVFGRDYVDIAYAPNGSYCISKALALGFSQEDFIV